MTAPKGYEKAGLLWQLLMDPGFAKHRCSCQERATNPKDCPMHGHKFPAKD